MGAYLFLFSVFEINVVHGHSAGVLRCEPPVQCSQLYHSSNRKSNRNESPMHVVAALRIAKSSGKPRRIGSGTNRTRLMTEVSAASTASPRRVGVVYDEVMLKHKNEYYPHPEQPARISRIHELLGSEGALAR